MTSENEREFENIQGVDAQAAALARRDEMREALVHRELAPQTVDAARVASETQAMILMARSRPREFLDIKRGMQTACARTRLAEKAVYNYPRGGTQVTGPSIRLMEMLVGVFGNVDAGWRVLEADDERARVEAYAWDLENNVRKRIEFWAPYSRDTKQGVIQVTAERDKYEVVASAAQRRVRACIANILPFDLVDEAMECCAETVKKGDGKRPLVDRIADMVLAFEEIGVSQAMIEEMLKHPITAIIVDELPRLRGVYTAITEGHAQREEFFKLTPVARGSAPEPTPASTKTGSTPTTAPSQASEKEKAPSGTGSTKDATEDGSEVAKAATKAVESTQATSTPADDSGDSPGTWEGSGEDDGEIQPGLRRPVDGRNEAEMVAAAEKAESEPPRVDAMKQAEDFVATRRKASSKAQEAARRALEGQQELGGGGLKK
jgi:hypothetical protein